MLNKKVKIKDLLQKKEQLKVQNQKVKCLTQKVKII